MDSFLKRISSRKFLSVLAVEVAAVVALFRPAGEAAGIEAGAVKIAALAVMILAALGYAKIEGAIDKARAENGG